MHKLEFKRRIRYQLGNIYRFITSPWCQYKIPVSKISNIFGCSFDSEGWHPIIATLKEYDNNEGISFKDTTLYKYHISFMPSDTNSFISMDIKYKFDLFIYPWGTFGDGSLQSKKVVENSRFCGPSSDKFISEEFDRIILLYKKLKKEGYKPMKFPNSFIGGTFLRNENGDYRFIVMQGNHRLSILAHLKYSQVSVRMISQAQKSVKEIDINNWIAVKLGYCSSEDAKKFFNFFFKEKGFQIKRILK